jgi:protein-tyrosine-phosphatase
MSDLIPISGPRPSVMFLCVHNAGRSQMAAGFLRQLAGDRVEVLSAGSAPGEAVNPAAVEAMDERGIDISAAVPRRWADSDLERVDVVITMGCGDDCPYVPGTIYEDWPLQDPAGQGVVAVRPIRDEIEARVRDLMRRVGVAARDR